MLLTPWTCLVLRRTGTRTGWFSVHAAHLVTRRGDAEHGVTHRNEQRRGLFGSQASAALVQDRLNGSDRSMNHRPKFNLIDRGPQFSDEVYPLF